MKIFIVVIAVAISLPLKNLSEFAAKKSKTWQSNCVRSLPTESKLPEMHSALICGKEIPPGEKKNILTQTSLYHLFVVSGAHLIFILTLLERLKIGFLGFFSVLFFTLLTGFQAPCLRAVFALLLTWFSTKNKLFWPTLFINFLSGALCLCLQPSLVNSKSLLLSWLASLALSINQKLIQPKCVIYSSTLVYIVLVPALWGWGSLHPVGIILNILIVPVFSLLLPIDFLSIFFPKMIYASDLMIDGLFWILKLATEIIPHTSQISFIPINLLWLYLFFINITAIFLYQMKRRADWRFEQA